MKKILLATVVMFGASAFAQEGAPAPTPAPAAEASAPAADKAPAKTKSAHKKGKHKKDDASKM